jgi:hypothetical protein
MRRFLACSSIKHLTAALYAAAALAVCRPGTGEEPIPLGNFQQDVGGFHLSLGQEFRGAKGSLTRDKAVTHDGRCSARLQADFSGGGVYVAMSKTLPDPIDLRELRFWAKSAQAKSLVVRLVDGTGQTHQQIVPLNADDPWQQLRITQFAAGRNYMHFGGAHDGQWHPPAKSLSLNLEKGSLSGRSQGTVWIEGIEALGTRLVQLFLKVAPGKLGNAYLEGEPVEFHLETNGEAVQWRIVDFWEQTLATGTVAVKDGACVLPIAAPKRGYFTLELKTAKPGAVTAEQTVPFAILTPLDRIGTEHSPFGVMTHFAQGWPTDIIPLIALSGAASTRDEIYWGTVEKTKGQFEFPPRYETYMGLLAQQHIEPLVPLTFGNEHYDGGQTPYTAEGFAAYARYGEQVLAHYGKGVRLVEIWNEYNGSFCKGPATKDRVGTYVKMLKEAYARIKAARPDVTVLGCDVVSIPLPFLEKLFQAGALDSLDALSFHPYRFADPPEGIEQDVARLSDLVKKYNGGRPKPLWVTEIGWYTKPATEPGDTILTEADQARFVVRGYTLLLSAGVQRVYWYLFRDYAEFGTMGLVRSDQNPQGRYAPKPAFVAFANLTRQLAQSRFVRREATANDIYALLFQHPQAEVRVIWSTTPTTLTVRAKEPLVLTDIMGAERTVAPTAGQIRLKLTDTPIYVRGTIELLPPVEASAESKLGPVLADSAQQFSGTQGQDHWYYGFYEGSVAGKAVAAYSDAAFQPLPTYRSNDWDMEWVGPVSWLSITRTGMHPAAAKGRPMWAVRRWVSPIDGRVHLAGQARRGVKGDGADARIFVDGREVFARLLGGGQPIAATIDLDVPVHAGSKIDFTLDPGPGTNFDFDGTRFLVTIRPLKP